MKIQRMVDKTEEGLECMRNLASATGDKDYLKWIDKYEKHQPNEWR